MKKILFLTLLFLILLLSLSMDCFTTGERRKEFIYDPDKANADLISKTDLSNYNFTSISKIDMLSNNINIQNNVGIDYKDNKLYLVTEKTILQYSSSNLTLENTYNISLDVTFDYNITSITHDDSHFYILANEFDQTGEVIIQYILKSVDFINVNEIFLLNEVHYNKILSIKYNNINNKIISHSEAIKYYPTSDGNKTEIPIYTLYYINLINSEIIYEKYLEDNERFSTIYSMFSFCTWTDNLIFCTFSDAEPGIEGGIIILEYIINKYISEYSDAVLNTIDTSYLGDKDYVCVYDMVFDGIYLWCLVNDDNEDDTYISGKGTPYLLKLKPRW